MRQPVLPQTGLSLFVGKLQFYCGFKIVVKIFVNVIAIEPVCNTWFKFWINHLSAFYLDVRLVFCTADTRSSGGFSFQVRTLLALRSTFPKAVIFLKFVALIGRALNTPCFVGLKW